MSTSYRCPICLKFHARGVPCRSEDVNAAQASLTQQQISVADVEETATILRYKARRNLPPETPK